MRPDISYLTNAHPAYIEELYRSFQNQPESIDPEYRKFFEGFDFARNTSAASASRNSVPATPAFSSDLSKELGVYRLIEAYIRKGHLNANINPVRARIQRKGQELDLPLFGLSEADLNTEFEAGKATPLGKTTLNHILDYLKKTYCGAIALQIESLYDNKKIEFLLQQFRQVRQQTFSKEEKTTFFKKISRAVLFEKFLHTKYIGQKRFSLEGLEALIPALHYILEHAARHAVQEAVIGMAHRGRLNVLVNVLNKSYQEIFTQFEPATHPNLTMGSGDVKYHLGMDNIVQTAGGQKMHVHLCSNPSHLEAVNPVVLGFARSRADNFHQSNYAKVLPILIHGDAAAAGQGIMYETVQMSRLKGYYTGGAIHIVTNNQIGFTADFDDTRSADYCTSVAALINAPALHVNANDIEAVIHCAQIAVAYRETFNEDIFINMVGYRKHGHNEGDDPKFTQPLLYHQIAQQSNVRDIYRDFLIQSGYPEFKDIAAQIETGLWARMQEKLDKVRQSKPLNGSPIPPIQSQSFLSKAQKEDLMHSPQTAISEALLRRLMKQLMHIPESFNAAPKIIKLLKEKIGLLEQKQQIDWATGELLAYASLLTEGKNIRMSGQDVKRGTFSHRHACLFDAQNNQEYNRLNHLSEQQGRFRIYNSLLSEYGVLGYEYGYSCADPETLTIWEAQFGDFANGAQIIIDQFLAGGEEKWGQQSGLVLLLPHGYEGQGPEHSSGRLERFLQLCAEYNLIVTNITESANFFHALRRQLCRPFRKPLINFSPKANLRHTGAYAPIQAFIQGGFKEVLDCPFSGANPDLVQRVLLCSGKIYFDLQKRQQEEQRKDIALIRLEQLYPLPVPQLEKLYQKYRKAAWFWVQEEPENMGAAGFLQQYAGAAFNFGILSRNASAAVSSGYQNIHLLEQNQLIATAFGPIQTA